MIDVDWFKNVNDTYEYQAGDQVLWSSPAHCAALLGSKTSSVAGACEEFLVVIPTTSQENVAAVAERFRAADADAITNEGDPAQHLNVTISVGGAVSTDRSPQAAPQVADAALYDAKLSGRNKVVIQQDSANDRVPRSERAGVGSIVS